MFWQMNSHNRNAQKELIFVWSWRTAGAYKIRRRQRSLQKKKWDSIVENYRDPFLRGTVGSVLGTRALKSVFQAWLWPVTLSGLQKATQIFLLPFTMWIAASPIKLIHCTWLYHVTCFVTQVELVKHWNIVPCPLFGCWEHGDHNAHSPIACVG